MFTGIIEATAPIVERTDTGLTVERPAIFDDLRPGSSVCVHGACLTVTAIRDATMTFDVVPETWSKTTLGSLQPGDRVNLERAMRADGRLDGHVVQGHVEGVGKVVRLEGGDGGTRMEITLPDAVLPFVIPKGSIAIDGVSLTVASTTSGRCILALIPTTLRETTLGTLRKDATVNIETDMLVRAVAALLPRR